MIPDFQPPEALRVLLCDADGCLFPSEEPAYEASAEVTNAALADLGIATRYTATTLRAGYTGRSFRSTLPDLCREHGVELSPGLLDHWVEMERDLVTKHLSGVLRPEAAVMTALGVLSRSFRLAVVSSSARARIDACLWAAAQSAFFEESLRFSAEDSLAAPASKPDPAIYRFAAQRLDARGDEAIAIEDSVPGVRSASAAGIPVVGLLEFVPVSEREHRASALLAAGAASVAETWEELTVALTGKAAVVNHPASQR